MNAPRRFHSGAAPGCTCPTCTTNAIGAPLETIPSRRVAHMTGGDGAQTWDVRWEAWGANGTITAWGDSLSEAVDVAQAMAQGSVKLSSTVRIISATQIGATS